ncbi:hypothetical protein BURK_032584 [Burkholderia sp. SJ98]|jgi:hypothetical protein|nr:hypothetical protein BURK_032584 [Burkholderia sp. SJ98]
MQVNSCRAEQATIELSRRGIGAPDGRENIMIRGEGRIVAALGAVFVTLGGINAALRGLLFDETSVMYYGVLAILIGAASFVVMLTPFPSDEP